MMTVLPHLYSYLKILGKTMTLFSGFTKGKTQSNWSCYTATVRLNKNNTLSYEAKGIVMVMCYRTL